MMSRCVPMVLCIVLVIWPTVALAGPGDARRDMDFVGNYNFTVQIDGWESGQFKCVDGLDSEIESMDFWFSNRKVDFLTPIDWEGIIQGIQDAIDWSMSWLVCDATAGWTPGDPTVPNDIVCSATGIFGGVDVASSADFTLVSYGDMFAEELTWVLTENVDLLATDGVSGYVTMECLGTTVTTTPVPEPGAMTLLGLGLAALMHRRAGRRD